MRVVLGYDVHRLVEGRDLILGGVKIPHEKGLLGHSDADVLLHALTDALLGAAALGDIGRHFPDTDERYHFMRELAQTARTCDESRFISAACLVDAVNLRIADRLEEHLDVIGFNEYYGWYDPDYEKLITILEESKPAKPVVISEFGADGYLSTSQAGNQVRGSEEEQKEIYEKQVELFKKTSYIQGTVPWILFDYRTPKRLGAYQKGYNIKGLVSADRKREKPAFSVMKKFYEEVMIDEQTD